MSSLLRDIVYALRTLARNPVFTGVVVATLALGIGLNTAVFSAIDALLLRPLPGVRDADELVQAYRTWPGGQVYGSNSIPHYYDLRDRSREVFTDAALWSLTILNLTVDGRPQRVFGAVVSANYFAVLGVSAARGRAFTPDEDEGRLAHPVVVLSHSGWQQMFGGAADAVGRSVVLNGQSYTVVGVTPPDFKGTMPIVSPTLFVPLMQLDHVRPGATTDIFEARGSNSFSVVARLAPGVALPGAEARMTALVGELRELYPNDYDDSGIHLVAQSEAGIHPMFKSSTVGLSSVVMAVVVMLLLIACVNVANLLLARAADRTREMAVRLSLGARRSVLVRQLLTESLVISGLAGAAGLGLAWWVIGLVNRVSLPVDIDLSADLSLSPVVLLFTLGVALATGVLFGLAPALQATRPALVSALKGETPAGGSKSRATRGLVVAQMALSIVLLVSAGLFVRNLQKAAAIDKGFDSDNLLIAQLDPSLQGYDRARTEDFYRRLTDRLASMPDVLAVGLADNPQLGLGNSDWGVTIPGYTAAPNEGMSIDVFIVGPGYFEAMGIPLLSGRPFAARDDSSAAGAIVVNRRFVERFWPDQDPIGRVVRTGGRDHTVIGVVPTGKYRSLGEAPLAFMYLAQAQHFEAGTFIHIRTRGDPTAIAPVLRAEVAALDPNLPVSDVRTMTSHLGIALLPARLAGAALGVFGLIGLTLASLGIYGVMAGAVARRKREIGIRIAIGAAGGSVVRLMLRDGLRLVGIGTIIGVAGALGVARLIGGLLYGGSGLDPVTFSAVPVLLTLVALLAIWIPARRASAVDPVEALRQE